MDVIVEVLRWTTTMVYLGAALVAFRMRRRSASAPATWLAAAFGSLGLILVWGLFAPEPPYSPGWLWSAKVAVAILATFPYALMRFALSVGPAATRISRTVLASVGALVVWTFLLPEFYAQEAPKPAWYTPYVVTFVAVWFVGIIVAGRLLWTGGRGQAPVVARRLRMMSIGAVLVASAVLGSLFAVGDARQPLEVRMVSSFLSGGSGLLFLLAFTAPRWLRAFWRRSDEQATRGAAASCIRAQSVGELCHTLLPHVQGVVGGTGAVLVSTDGNVLGSIGLTDADAKRIASSAGAGEHAASVLCIELEHGRLCVALNDRAPFAGDEETSLLHSFGGFADAALERLALLERTDRMRAEFIAMLSHDMRAPLTAARGMIETLASEWDELDVTLRRELLARASSNGIKLGAMIEQMLEHSQLEAGRIETLVERVNLGRAVADVVEHLGTLLDGHRVVTDVPPGLYAIADRQAVERILTNLVINAAKFAPAGTRITVAATRRGDTVTLDVSDEGPGIPPEDRSRVFDSFYRGSQTHGSAGLGLGLAIVRRLAELQNGSVEIMAREYGSTFVVVLPGGGERVSSVAGAAGAAGMTAERAAG
ncbi:MAG TPA: ATP-binding protein [Actinomycetota bacterium]|nr:ATP-binding protein [Actinomycetota bacterium]